MNGKQASPKDLAGEIGKQRPFDIPEAEAYLNLVRTHEQLEAGFAALFKAHGVTGPQYNVLRILRGHGRRMRTSQIAGDMLTREPDITRLIDRMVERGLVTRERCPEDRRVVWVELAEAGARLLKRLDRPVVELHERQLGHLGERRLRELSRLLLG
jgi:DNA-binding MarR family transcriptional regulator